MALIDVFVCDEMNKLSAGATVTLTVTLTITVTVARLRSHLLARRNGNSSRDRASKELYRDAEPLVGETNEQLTSS